MPRRVDPLRVACARLRRTTKQPMNDDTETNGAPCAIDDSNERAAKERREEQARRFTDQAAQALAKGNVVKAYPLFRKAMQLRGLPIDWFSPYRAEGAHVH